MAQDLEVKVSPLGGLQGQVLNKEAGRAMALLVSATSEPLELPRQLVHLVHPLCYELQSIFFRFLYSLFLWEQ